MRHVLIGLALLVGPGVMIAACGQDPGTTSTGSGSSASGTGGAPYCGNVHLDSVDDTDIYPCNICLQAKCCAEIAGCVDEACVECANAPMAGCSELSLRARKCAEDRCFSACHPGLTTGAGGAGGAMNSSASSG